MSTGDIGQLVEGTMTSTQLTSSLPQDEVLLVNGKEWTEPTGLGSSLWSERVKEKGRRHARRVVSREKEISSPEHAVRLLIRLGPSSDEISEIYYHPWKYRSFLYDSLIRLGYNPDEVESLLRNLGKGRKSGRPYLHGDAIQTGLAQLLSERGGRQYPIRHEGADNYSKSILNAAMQLYELAQRKAPGLLDSSELSVIIRETPELLELPTSTLFGYIRQYGVLPVLDGYYTHMITGKPLEEEIRISSNILRKRAPIPTIPTIDPLVQEVMDEERQRGLPPSAVYRLLHTRRRKHRLLEPQDTFGSDYDAEDLAVHISDGNLSASASKL